MPARVGPLPLALVGGQAGGPVGGPRDAELTSGRGTADVDPGPTDISGRGTADVDAGPATADIS